MSFEKLTSVKDRNGDWGMSNCDVAIVGAEPYGLSVAAHLKATGVISAFSEARWSFG
jgi:ribulose 1,5-bisphosphate synthetase/thiazole synthase